MNFRKKIFTGWDPGSPWVNKTILHHKIRELEPLKILLNYGDWIDLMLDQWHKLSHSLKLAKENPKTEGCSLVYVQSQYHQCLDIWIYQGKPSLQLLQKNSPICRSHCLVLRMTTRWSIGSLAGKDGQSNQEAKQSIPVVFLHKWVEVKLAQFPLRI